MPGWRLPGALLALTALCTARGQAQRPERTGVAVGLEAVWPYDREDRFFHTPGFGVASSGAWRTGRFGVEGGGALVRFYGRIPAVPDVWLFTVAAQARVYPVAAAYLGLGVGVYSSSNDLEDEIGPTLSAGVALGRYEFSACYKTNGLNLLTIRAMLFLRRH